jgi:hypothetical protein
LSFLDLEAGVSDTDEEDGCDDESLLQFINDLEEDEEEVEENTSATHAPESSYGSPSAPNSRRRGIFDGIFERYDPQQPEHAGACYQEEQQNARVASKETPSRRLDSLNYYEIIWKVC